MISIIVIGICIVLYIVIDRFIISKSFRKIKDLVDENNKTPQKISHSRYMPLHIEKIDVVDETSIGKQFKQQQQRMQFQAMIPHEADCDIISCRKEVCFIRVPDKIVRVSNMQLVPNDELEVPKDTFNTINTVEKVKERKRRQV